MKLFFGNRQPILSESQLRRLGEHRYSCQDVSVLDKVLNPYWNWLTAQIPLWVAPNLITITGLIINVLTALILVWHSPDAKIDAPRWACGLCGIGLFIYQSLDAIDGKQARRTGSANPLGELFDHGCDSISTVFVALSLCASMQLGQYPGWMFFQCFSGMTLFYCAHWQTYVSGTLRFGRIDVTEAQFAAMTIMLISTIFGTSVWTTTIPLIDIEIRVIPICVALVLFLVHGQANIAVIFTGGVGKNGSTVAGTSVLSPIIPFSMVLVPAFIIYQKSTQQIYENHPSLYILAFGLVAAKVTNRLVVAHMTKSEMYYTDWSLMGPAMLFLNQYFNTFIHEHYVLWICTIWVAFDLLRYCCEICKEICKYLHVELFRLPISCAAANPPYKLRSTVEKNGTNNVVKSRKSRH